jgi:hypothetical protein
MHRRKWSWNRGAIDDTAALEPEGTNSQRATVHCSGTRQARPGGDVFKNSSGSVALHRHCKTNRSTDVHSRKVKFSSEFCNMDCHV